MSTITSRNVIADSLDVDSGVVNDTPVALFSFKNVSGGTERFILIPDLDQYANVRLHLFDDNEYWREALDRGGKPFIGDYESLSTISVEKGDVYLAHDDSDKEEDHFHTDQGKSTISAIADWMNDKGVGVVSRIFTNRDLRSTSPNKSRGYWDSGNDFEVA